MRVGSPARKTRAGAREPKECSESGSLSAVEVVEPFRHRDIAGLALGRRRLVSRTLRPRRRSRCGRDRGNLFDGVSSVRDSGHGDSRFDVRLGLRFCPATSSVSPATTGFLRRFLPPRLPRRVLRFTTGAPSPSAPFAPPTLPRRAPRGRPRAPLRGRAPPRPPPRGSPRVTAGVGVAGDMDPRRTTSARHLGLLAHRSVRTGLGSLDDDCLGGADRGGEIVGCLGSGLGLSTTLDRSCGGGLAPAAAAARATAGPLLGGRRPVRCGVLARELVAGELVVVELLEIGLLAATSSAAPSSRSASSIGSSSSSAASRRRCPSAALRPRVRLPACGGRGHASASRPRSRT